MADSIYDQVLTIAYPQIQTLADAIEAYMTQEVDLAPRRFDWEDIQSHSPGLSLRWSPDAIAPGNNEGTNAHNPIGCVLHLVMTSPQSMTRSEEDKAFELLKQSVRQYYHHRRRMNDVLSDGVLAGPSTVRDGGPEPPKALTDKWNIQQQTITFHFLEPQTA